MTKNKVRLVKSVPCWHVKDVWHDPETGERRELKKPLGKLKWKLKKGKTVLFTEVRDQWESDKVSGTLETVCGRLGIEKVRVWESRAFTLWVR